MPKRVDPLERRRHIAQAVFRVTASHGAEAVSLRDVAAEAGVSMGMVQHYFRTKDEMLLFALEHMRERVATRLHARLAHLPEATPRDLARAVFTELLPTSEDSRAEAAVSVAFYSRAAVTPAYAAALSEGLRGLLAATTERLRAAQRDGHLHPDLDPEQEAASLFWLTHGLVGPLLAGLYTPAQALAILDHSLDRIFIADVPTKDRR
ncbi:TetR family transcriptional regulator C-terminal domain-containing protein [Frankia sp. AgPm24]|uniref:TetR family transcriptional regulator C-terminal domain-containing protein n=1 Tax=Frankia umida TaxID=573489 RepID=A0ABT0K119_9ACTN|nr:MULTISPECIES: TetR family transcriptional regulator C-terminal domain-containing protein [Frankia]MCK9877487.1 TetR family transcriptional regulator C-terminal domain-containing protein [Frankia umida]MCK9923188.1 TetR family transcriptional regulator C-terminal domain-containing protein [Frankia sp. AgPm24]